MRAIRRPESALPCADKSRRCARCLTAWKMVCCWPSVRLSGAEAAIEGARSRLRPILMTSLAMMAGMFPMALGVGESGEQTAPLGRAVIGGLAAATMATLLVLPSVFALVRARASTKSRSLDPDDPLSGHYVSPARSAR